MIPSDVASRLQVTADTTLRPVAPTQEIADKLTGLVAGQKVLAEIQALLPNGTYRAMINQRNVTLSLPFSAKAGDSMELQVTESDGKLALALVTRQETAGSKPPPESASATLSRTGQMISTLYSGAREARGNSTALPLNANQPITPAPPGDAGDLVPLLKQAIGQSGMFYESHQAGWFEGRFAKSALLQEPQGKLSSPSAFASPGLVEPNSNTNIEQALRNPAVQGESAAPPRLTAENPQAAVSSSEAAKSAAPQQSQMIAPQLQTLVQQQLEALATQNFSWQGQIWPGQEMRWEIDEDASRQAADEDTAPRWSTHLRMNLPNLGVIDAQIQLQGNQVSLAMSAGNAATRDLMRAAGLSLSTRLNEAGLSLASMGVDAVAETSGDEQVRE